MTRKTTPKKPSQLDRIEKLLRTTRAIMDGKIIVGDDRLDNMLGKLDLLLKGSDFMKEIEEQVKAQEWAKVTELQEGDACRTSSEEVREVIDLSAPTFDTGKGHTILAGHPYLLWFNGKIKQARPDTDRAIEWLPFPEFRRRLEGTIAKRKAQEQEAKKAKLVWGTKVMYGNSEGIFLDHDDNDNTCWVALKPTGNCDWLSISDLTIIDP